MGDSGIGAPPPTQSTNSNDSNTIIVEVQIEHQESIDTVQSENDVAGPVRSPDGNLNGSDSGLEDNQQQWRSKRNMNRADNTEDNNFLLQIQRHEFAEQIQSSIKSRKVEAKKEPDTMIRELKSKLKQKFNAPSTANSSVISRSAQTTNSLSLIHI